MKGYINKIIAITLLIVVFVVSFNTKIDYNIDKRFRTLAASNKGADNCTTGDGEVYYVNTQGSSKATIRNSASSTGSSLGTLDKCTQVMVYCKSGSYSKISKVSEKWVLTSSLSLTGTGCASVKTTTTDPITYGSVALKYVAYGTGANDVNQMYRDKPGKIIMTLKGIKNVASDDQNNISVTIKDSSNRDVTTSFDIARTGVSGGEATFTFKMKSGLVYNEGQYTVYFGYGNDGRTKISKTFQLVGRYYHFTINVKKTVGPSSSPANKTNTWKVALENIEPLDATISNYTLRVLNSKGIDCTEHFKITPYNSGMYFEITNYKYYTTAPLPGEYKIVVKYNNTAYTTVRRNYEASYKIIIGPRTIEFDEQVDLRTSYRYTRYEETSPYTMKIVEKTNTTITIKELDSYGVYQTKTMTLNDFVSTFEDFDSSVVNFIDNRPVITFNTIKITRFYNGIYYYFDGASNKTATLEELEDAYPGITETINSIDAISKIRIYTFDNNGYVEYNAKGNKTNRKKHLQDKNKPILSVTGGQLNFKIRYSYLSDKDKKVMPVITKSDGTVVKAKDGFRVIKQEYEENSTEDTVNNIMNLTIDYDNTKEKYSDTYYVTYTFENVKDSYSFSFSILDGEIDYYLQSSSDGHLTDPFDAYNGTPPGNKRYEWYLGFYMMKSGLLMDTKPSNSMSVKIYTEQADCTNKSSLSACESSLYFYRQKNYIIELLNYKNGNITFNLTYDNVVQASTITMPIEEFKNKYAEAFELFDNYQFDETTGDLLETNNFRIKVLKLRTDFETSSSYVTYIDENGNTIVEEDAEIFNKKYPEYYYNNTLRYVFDENDAIVNGQIRGSLKELNDDKGNPYVGTDVTDQFDISIDANPYNLERAITVLPKVEVLAGTYYAYVGFEGALGVGYNNNFADAVITKESYPEMWNRNIHMTSISYSEPQYDVEIDEPKLSNTGNNSSALYANIESTGEFKIKPKYIYNLDGFSYSVEKQEGSSWVDVTSNFAISSKFTSEDSQITLKTVPGTTEGGNYRLVVNYQNNGYGLMNGPEYEEFSVKPKYYGLVFESTEEIAFAKNFSENKYFEATGYFIDNPENVELSIVRIVDKNNVDKLDLDKANKQFTKDGKVIFKYDVSYTRNDDNPNLLSYSVRLTNQQNAAVEGEYELIATYKEGTNEPNVSSRKFKVTGNVYDYTIDDNERPRVDTNNKYTIQRDVYVSYINRDKLDDINYVIKYYDRSVKDYVDVSSENAQKRMFKITSGTPVEYNSEFNGQHYEYKITLYIDVDVSKAPINEDASFLIDLEYEKSHREFKFSSLNDLFAWTADLKINGIFHDASGDVNVDKFYLNVSDVTLDVKLDTPHESNANFSVTKCLGDTCQPSVAHEYNELFDATIERDRIVLKYKGNIPNGIKITKGEYALIIYYSDRDKIILPFQVETEFVKIAFDDAVMYSDITASKTVPNLFKNKKGHIEIPVTVFGTTYANTLVKVTDINGNGDYTREFKYSEATYLNNHLLNFTYNANTAEFGEYMITVEYTNADNKVISDKFIFTLNKAYFNFELSDPLYEPNPPVANADPYGKVIYTISTENVFDGLSETEKYNQKKVFAANTVITNADNIDVTNLFEIAPTSESPVVDFDMYIKYLKNKVEPGVYKVKVTYRLNDYNVTKYSYFEIGEYEKSISIKNVETISNTEDGIIHNNTGGIFKINYESVYDISVADIGVVIKNPSSTTVNDSFMITKYSNYINIELIPKTPAIASGKYIITITYTDPGTGKVTTSQDIEVMIYGKYKKILIKDMIASAPIIYADLANQYYTFDLDVANISNDELSKMQTRIYDSYGNVVYSSIDEDKVSNIFNVNRLDSPANRFKIDILAFKAPVGEYAVELLLKNEDNDYNVSNRLSFSVNKTKYKIRLSSDSKVTPSKIYNNDESAFYDADSALVNYKFTSDYPNQDAVYSIKVIKNGITVREINDINLGSLEEWGITYLTSILNIDSLEVGKYDIDICLNGLPYDGKTINVYKYVPVRDIALTINSKVVSNVALTVGKNVEFVTYIDPANATNKEIKIISSNESIFKVSGNNLVPVGKGNAKLIIDHPDFHKEIDISVANELTSDIYEINYVDKTIFVNTINVKRFTKELLIRNLNNLSSDYQVLNKNNNVINDNASLVGTGSKVISGGQVYTVIVIGDLNGDGTIGFGDVSYLYDIYTGYTSANEIIKKAGRIRKADNITFGDVNKLFDFYRGIINEI